jgi:hypothetical protein
LETEYIDEVFIQGNVKPENEIQLNDRMEILKSEKRDNEIEYIDSIELIYSPHEWTTIPSHTDTLEMKGEKKNNLSIFAENINKLENIKPENEMKERDSLVIISAPEEPLKSEYIDELYFKRNIKPENKMQLVNQMEILSIGKPDNIIEYIDSIEILYCHNDWITIPSDISTLMIKGEKKVNPNPQCTSKLEILSKKDQGQQKEEKDKIIKKNELEISQFSFKLSTEEKKISIIFVSFDQNIIYSIICKSTDIFSLVENKFYEKYSEYKILNNYFILNGKKIDKNKSLFENKIKNNDIITIFN